MFATAFDDMPSDLDAAQVRAPSAAEAAAPVYTQPCPKCRGSGRYRGPSSYGSNCFKCGGSGTLTFKTSPFERAKRRAQEAAREERKMSSRWDEFKAANKVEAEWIEQRAASFDFAQQMRLSVERWGRLTPGQLAAVQRCIARDIDRELLRQQAAARAETAQQVDTQRLEKIVQAFDSAKGRGIKYPKMRLAEFVFSPAPASGKNAGAIYVKSVTRTDDGEGAYLGKIAGGRFMAARECSQDLEAKIVTAASDPEAAATAYGKQFGQCSICARELSDPESIERGIGPVCAKRMGW